MKLKEIMLIAPIAALHSVNWELTKFEMSIVLLESCWFAKENEDREKGVYNIDEIPDPWVGFWSNRKFDVIDF